jgi:hypothetical protein
MKLVIWNKEWVILLVLTFYNSKAMGHWDHHTTDWAEEEQLRVH